MLIRIAALAACLLALLAGAPARASERLTLDDALRRIEHAHPDLRLTGFRRDVLSAERDQASLRPPLVLAASIDNILGSGERRLLDSAEATVTLASVFERGGKLDARKTLAQTRIDALGVERETKRLDLLAEVARRYLAIAAAGRQREIAQHDIAQRKRTVAGARHRFSAGASPQSVVFAAEAALARAELEYARAAQREASSKQHLAALWGERDPAFQTVAGNPYALPAIAPFAELADWLQRTPEITQFNGELRIREARLQLARTQATPDWDWQMGARYFREGGDVALIASASLPLGARQRAQPGIRVAEAELAMLGIERESKQIELYSTLAEAHGNYLGAQLEVRRLGRDVIPKLGQAENAAERAYRAGAISYLEWAQLQSERTDARKQQLDAALEAQRALIEIQRLTGQAFASAQAANEQGEDP
ncbi:MAG: TolC family protein [Pseudomonadota bacterium]|nr:TolC family protein [Pseudomonadota bacterium]